MSPVDAAAIAPVADALDRALPGRVQRDAPLGDLTTYRLGGPAAVLVRATRVDDVVTLGRVLGATPGGDRAPLLVVGKGSNLLVADAGFAGVVLVLAGELERVSLPATAEAPVVAGGGVPLPVLARRTAAAALTGLEFYVGIPGTVGGAVRMNAGGHGRETRDVLLSATVVDVRATEPQVTRRLVTDLALGYRQSALGGGDVVVGAEFAVAGDDAAACEARVSDIVRWRRQNQPGGANAGSVFRNPPGDAAGRVIEQCGLKGHRIGGAVVSEKHANFIQADAGARAEDVRALVVDVQRRVESETGIRLVPELHLVGFEGPS
jgi:UDP-N-acetylmuramate dehydrogenase